MDTSTSYLSLVGPHHIIKLSEGGGREEAGRTGTKKVKGLAKEPICMANGHRQQCGNR